MSFDNWMAYLFSTNSGQYIFAGSIGIATAFMCLWHRVASEKWHLAAKIGCGVGILYWIMRTISMFAFLYVKYGFEYCSGLGVNSLLTGFIISLPACIMMLLLHQKPTKE